MSNDNPITPEQALAAFRTAVLAKDATAERRARCMLFNSVNYTPRLSPENVADAAECLDDDAGAPWERFEDGDDLWYLLPRDEGSVGLTDAQMVQDVVNDPSTVMRWRKS